MVGRYPFRDPNRIRPDDAGNRRDRPDDAGNRRDRPDDAGNRIDRPREREEISGNRVDRPRQGEQRRTRERPVTDEQPVTISSAPTTTPLPVDMAALTATVEAMVRLVKESGINELQVENGQFKLIVRYGNSAVTSSDKGQAVVPVVLQQPLALSQEAAPAAPVAAPVATAPLRAATLPESHPTTSAPQLAAGEHLITSPMVGTFYAGPSPKDPPFVSEGDAVDAGQTVGIIEAMKMMNPIEAETTGRIIRVLVLDRQTVEYGQPLMVIAEGS